MEHLVTMDTIMEESGNLELIQKDEDDDDVIDDKLKEEIPNNTNAIRQPSLSSTAHEGDDCHSCHSENGACRLEMDDTQSNSREDSLITPFLDPASGSDSSEDLNGNDVYDLDLQQLSRAGSCVSDEEYDTLASGLDLEKINSIKSRTSEDQNHKRKESFEQRLRRTFTIRDAHTSEVTRRILAVFIKYSLFVFNFVSWILAIAAIGLGIWMRTDKTLLVTTDTEFYLDLPLLTCIGGAVTFVVAFLGCVGALRENLILLKVFFYVLIFILVGEMILAVTVFIIYTVPEARDNFLRSQPEKILYSAIHRYMDDMAVQDWVDRIQSEFKCCGVSKTDEGFRDWKTSPYFNCSLTNRSIYRCAVPKSCCIFEQGDRVNIMCGFEKTDKPLSEVRDYIHTRGCIIGFGEWLGKYNNFIIISCLSIIIMQFLAVLSAKVMVIRIRKQRSRWRPLQSNCSSSANTMTRT
ncbi:Tetraspanin-5 [Mactra antiquata]